MRTGLVCTTCELIHRRNHHASSECSGRLLAFTTWECSGDVCSILKRPHRLLRLVHIQVLRLPLLRVHAVHILRRELEHPAPAFHLRHGRRCSSIIG